MRHLVRFWFSGTDPVDRATYLRHGVSLGAIEGSTWYELSMAPEGYWQLFSDAIIHRIHRRVLDHIKREAEQAAGRRVS
jgi:hypothetical protein